jgi:hypothetical protein
MRRFKDKTLIETASGPAVRSRLSEEKLGLALRCP